MIHVAQGVSFKQDNPATTWVINHNKGRVVTVDVIVEYEGQMEKILPWRILHSEDRNTVTVKFTAPFKGEARLV